MKKEFSKKICVFTYALFCVAIFLGMAFAMFGMESDIIITLISTTAALAAASTTFYYNKAKAENLVKIRLDVARQKAEILGEAANESILQEIENIDEQTEEELNGMFAESIQEETEINL